MPGILVLTSYQNLGLFVMWLNSMFEIIFSMKIKYDDSRNWNNFAMENITIVNILIWYKITTPTFAWYYLCLKLTQFNIVVVMSLRIKYYDENKLKLCVMRGEISLVLIQLKSTTLTLDWNYCCFGVTQPCNKNNIRIQCWTTTT